MSKKLLSAVCAAVLLAGCADNINSDHYSTDATGSGDTTAGTMIGGIAGGVAGSTIGRGRGSALGAVGGALLGGLAGSAAQKGLSSQTGYEYIVKLDNGQAISITQGAAQPLMVGQRCLVLYGNPSRIIAQ